MQTQKKKGNQLLNDELARRVREGVVDAEEAVDKAVDKEGLKRLTDRR
jgi:Tfp pilus assembly pilus retraction ATPase PilT